MPCCVRGVSERNFRRKTGCRSNNGDRYGVSLEQSIKHERSPALIKAAKALFKREEGRLNCQVRAFDFYECYGEIGQDFVEAHHTKPISELDKETKTKVEDIALVCSNCHRMLHRRRPWLRIEELESLISRNTQSIEQLFTRNEP